MGDSGQKRTGSLDLGDLTWSSKNRGYFRAWPSHSSTKKSPAGHHLALLPERLSDASPSGATAICQHPARTSELLSPWEKHFCGSNFETPTQTQFLWGSSPRENPTQLRKTWTLWLGHFSLFSRLARWWRGVWNINENQPDVLQLWQEPSQCWAL